MQSLHLSSKYFPTRIVFHFLNQLIYWSIDKLNTYKIFVNTNVWQNKDRFIDNDFIYSYRLNNIYTFLVQIFIKRFFKIDRTHAKITQGGAN